MSFSLASALVLASVLLAPSALGQAADDAAPARRILTLDGTRPSLDALRAAIRARDPGRAHRLADEVLAGARAARVDLEHALEELGGRVLEHFWIIDGCVVEVPGSQVDALAGLPHVAGVWEDGLRAPGEFAPIKTSTNMGNHRTDAVQFRGVNGAGVTVAVVDSGLDEQMSSLNRPHRVFFVNGDPNNQTGGGIGGSRMLANVQVGAYPADDPIDHGTRVAGVAIGAKWNTRPESDRGHAPEAKVVGYSLVDTASGQTVLATMTRAWQRCALEAARYGTQVAVVSYDGTYDPLSPEQQAMDACAELADIVVGAMAGNVPNQQRLYQGATNVLVGGAVTHDAHVATSFTARGPLASPGVPVRVYPHLVANGDLIVSSSADREASSSIASGTSYAGPAIAGAAALFRSVATNASAEETRAAILATLDDARGPNPNDADAVGHGYLRVDRLIDLAQGRVNGTFARGSVDLANPSWSTVVQAQAGEVYAAALAFSRRAVGSLAWANLDLRVRQGSRTLAESALLADTHERVVFRVPATGSVTIEVFARSFEIGTVAQQFGVAAVLAPLPVITAYGQGCPAASVPGVVREVEPSSLTSSFGNAASDTLIGGQPHRTQQWIATDTLHAAFNVDGLAFRHDEAAGSGPWPRSWVELDATFDLTLAAPSSMSPTFAQNLGRLATQVITRKRFVLPSIAAPNSSPGAFEVVLPLDQRFDRLYDPVGPNPGMAQDLIVDIRTYATSAGGQPLRYPLDAVTGMNGVATVTAPSPTATSGTLTQGAATVIGLMAGVREGQVPQLSGFGAPSIGATYGLELVSAPAAAQAWLTVGFSRTSNGGVPLPFDLAPIGAPGCFLLADVREALVATTSASGAATFSVPVPATPALRGGMVFHQGIVSDLGANQLGIVTSGAIEVIVGQ